jgi:hypothetical protein
MGDEVSETAQKLKELLPIWAELTGVIIKLICKLLAERETK